VHVLGSDCNHLRPDLDFWQEMQIVEIGVEGLVDLDVGSSVSAEVFAPVLIQSDIDSAEEIMCLLGDIVLLILGEKIPVSADWDGFPVSKEHVSGNESVGLDRVPCIERRGGGRVVGGEEVFDGRLACWALRVGARLLSAYSEVEVLVVLVVPCGEARDALVSVFGDTRGEVLAVVGAPRVSSARVAELVETQEKAAGYAARERSHEVGEVGAGS
jgi:hypothetical protein